MILLSLASKQIWPQVLAAAHLPPERVCRLRYFIFLFPFSVS